MSGRFFRYSCYRKSYGREEIHLKNDGKSAASREDRLKAALKANMARRKAQAKVREPDKQDQKHGQGRGE